MPAVNCCLGWAEFPTRTKTPLSRAFKNWLNKSNLNSRVHPRLAPTRPPWCLPKIEISHGGCVYGASSKNRTATIRNRHHAGRHGGTRRRLPAIHGISERSQERQPAQRLQPTLCGAHFLLWRGDALSCLRHHWHS